MKPSIPHARPAVQADPFGLAMNEMDRRAYESWLDLMDAGPVAELEAMSDRERPAAGRREGRTCSAKSATKSRPS